MENDPRIRIRGARLAVLKEVMNASDKIRIQYANKYAGSSNYWKNSIGMNKAIIDNDVLGRFDTYFYQRIILLYQCFTCLSQHDTSKFDCSE